LTITCGIDWAEQRHDVAVVDDQGRVLARRRIDPGVAGFSELTALQAQLAGGPDDALTVPVAIETDKNLLVVALQAAGFTVYPINPMAVARTEIGPGRPAPSPTPETLACWPTSCAPTPTGTGPADHQ
jgi:transposase